MVVNVTSECCNVFIFCVWKNVNISLIPCTCLVSHKVMFLLTWNMMDVTFHVHLLEILNSKTY